MKPYILLLSFLATGFISKAQRNFVRTDALGMCYAAFEPNDNLKSVWGPKFSLAYERSSDSSKFSFGMQLNIGYTPVTGITSDVQTGKTIRASVYRGVSIQPEIRYYVSKKQIGHASGFFLNGYLMFFTGKTKTYAFYSQPPGEGNILLDNDPIIMLGGGIGAGYKQIFLKNFFVEPMLGLGYGYCNTETKTGNITSYTSLHFTRLELSLGYRF